MSTPLIKRLPIKRFRTGLTRLAPVATLFVLAAVSGPTGADTLLVDAVKNSDTTAGERPSRGMSMKSVEARFGAPANRQPAVGQPPITRWDYADYSVYFEYQHVIHAVQKR